MCEQNLRNDLEMEDEALRNVSQQVHLLMQLSTLDMQGLDEVERAAGEIEETALGIGGTLEEAQTSIDSISATSTFLQTILRNISLRVSPWPG